MAQRPILLRCERPIRLGAPPALRIAISTCFTKGVSTRALPGHEYAQSGHGSHLQSGEPCRCNLQRIAPPTSGVETST